jgi:hypothetical protein
MYFKDRTITDAKYISSFDGNNNMIVCTIDDVTYSVPLDPKNEDYEEILRQVAAGELTIADAD